MQRGLPFDNRALKIRLLWVGKTKAPYVSCGIDHYIKLLTPMINLSLCEIKGVKGRAKEDTCIAEGRRILASTTSYFLLDERGKGYSSLDFALFLKRRLLDDKSIDFVIGGCFGVSDEVRANARETLSLSMMTMTHEMVRMVFLEQLYRAFTIINHREYHY